MQAPKQRQNSSRTRRRRGGHGIMKKQESVVCKSCSKKIVSHRVCPYCGAYKGKEMIDVTKSIKNKAEKK